MASSAVKPLPVDDLDHVLTHTRDLWAEAKGKSFLITGGTGFFGMWLLESFTHINDALGLGMRAVVLSRDPCAFAVKAPHLFKRTDITFVAGDVRGFSFPNGQFPYVIHAATEASVKLNEDAPQEMLDAIISGTRRVLDFAAQAGTTKFLITSSGAVYGPQPFDIKHLPESYCGAPDPLLSKSAYGEGKRVSEHMSVVHGRQNGYDVKVARCFAFFGPHLPMESHFAAGNFLRDALLGSTIKIAGDGTPARSYLYASDLAIWLWTLLFKGSPGKAYNVGSDDDLSIRELAALISNILNKGSDIVLAKEPSGLPASRYVPSIEAAKVDLNLRVLVPLADSIKKTAAWCS